MPLTHCGSLLCASAASAAAYKVAVLPLEDSALGLLGFDGLWPGVKHGTVDKPVRYMDI